MKGRFDIEQNKLYLSVIELDTWMSEKRIPSAQVMHGLQQEGALLGDEMVNLGENTSKYSTAPVRAYIFDVGKLRDAPSE
jgi:hypothetical protein